MFHLLKKRRQKLFDIEGQELKDGDKVMVLRYDMGVCTLLNTGKSWVYRSDETGQEMSYARMFDAYTKRQKVRKLET
ncbi:MAG: hypothetical protein ACQESW_02250 [Bacteroidota bacterium]